MHGFFGYLPQHFLTDDHILHNTLFYRKQTMFSPLISRTAFRAPWAIRTGFPLSLRAFHSRIPGAFAFTKAPLAKGPKPLALLLGSTLTVAALHLTRPILNDTFAQPNRVQVNVPLAKTGRLGNYLNYEELAIGSVTGLFLGIVAAKLSSVIVFLVLSSYFLVLFLESRGVIDIPWNSIISVGQDKSRQIDVKRLVLHKPSFKVSFALAFLIAAFNV